MYVLKHRPEDFMVEEIAGFALKPTGNHLVVRVTKRGRNTEDVARLLAAQLGLPRKAVGYAGAKDRHAVTTQYFSLKGVTQEAAAALRLVDVTVVPLGYLDAPLGLGALEANRFTITVRNLEGDEDFSLPRAVPNYFDEQRFGTNNAVIGRALLGKEWAVALAAIRGSDAPEVRLLDEYLRAHPGDVIGALLRLPRHLLRMYLHAYQSLLWNRALADYVCGAGCPTRTVPYSAGAFVFPEKRAFLKNAVLPVPGFTIMHEPHVEKVLAAEGLGPRDFVIRQLPNLSLEGALRDALITVKDFSASAFSDDELFSGKKKVVLTFSLSRGSYATIVVRSLF